MVVDYLRSFASKLITFLERSSRQRGSSAFKRDIKIMVSVLNQVIKLMFTFVP